MIVSHIQQQEFQAENSIYIFEQQWPDFLLIKSKGMQALKNPHSHYWKTEIIHLSFPSVCGVQLRDKFSFTP